MTPEEKEIFQKMREVINAHSTSLKNMSGVINRQNRRIQLLETILDAYTHGDKKRDVFMQNLFAGLKKNG